MDTARELSDHLASLYRNERNAMADFLIALAAFDERKAWREIGYPSLWAFLRHELKLSKSAAFHRKTAATLVQAYPAAQIARAVWKRSGGRCECTLPNGERCAATRALEIDHIQPFALGGEATE